MKVKNAALLFKLMLLPVLCCSCNSLTQSAGHEASAADMKKTLVPHQSWTCGMPDGIPVPESGIVIFEARMKLNQVYNVGKTQFGQRQVLVVQDGSVTGDKIQGVVLPGGLDFQLTLSNGVIEIEQVLVIRTSDGNYIYMRNAGTGTKENDVRVVMDFEAPNGSSSEYLNTGKYIARRTVDPDAMTLKMTVYDISKPAAKLDTADAVRILKPAGVLPQPWDYRKASPSEKPGDQFIIETVALGGSNNVGRSKRGIRNIIPITGGNLTGNITGKVLFGGADYQNLANPATIDARYLWQTNDGEIIIVRNAGQFGSLVPTFEAKVDGKYSWLNNGNYLSSNPGMGAGGVSLTMYKSR